LISGGQRVKQFEAYEISSVLARLHWQIDPPQLIDAVRVSRKNLDEEAKQTRTTDVQEAQPLPEDWRILFCPLCDAGIGSHEKRVGDVQAHFYWHQFELMKKEGR
jgi:hypothetical protein